MALAPGVKFVTTVSLSDGVKIVPPPDSGVQRPVSPGNNSFADKFTSLPHEI